MTYCFLLFPIRFLFIFLGCLSLFFVSCSPSQESKEAKQDTTEKDITYDTINSEDSIEVELLTPNPEGMEEDILHWHAQGEFVDIYTEGKTPILRIKNNEGHIEAFAMLAPMEKDQMWAMITQNPDSYKGKQLFVHYEKTVINTSKDSINSYLYAELLQ
ncbi:MAG: hypothetical protein JJT94_09235 [Bernardetiaceae bacterium]|nr:hypothetical protein [Bernardetiaceae bacterium]